MSFFFPFLARDSIYMLYRIISYRNVNFWGASSKTPAPRP